MKQMRLDVRRIDLVELVVKLNEMCDKLDPVQLAKMASREALENLDQVRMISVKIKFVRAVTLGAIEQVLWTMLYLWNG